MQHADDLTNVTCDVADCQKKIKPKEPFLMLPLRTLWGGERHGLHICRECTINRFGILAEAVDA